MLAYKDSGSDSNNDSDKKSLLFLIEKKKVLKFPFTTLLSKELYSKTISGLSEERRSICYNIGQIQRVYKAAFLLYNYAERYLPFD